MRCAQMCPGLRRGSAAESRPAPKAADRRPALAFTTDRDRGISPAIREGRLRALLRFVVDTIELRLL